MPKKNACAGLLASFRNRPGKSWSLMIMFCLCVSITASPLRLVAEDTDAERLKSEIIASFDFAKHRKIPQVTTRLNEAAVLMSGVEVPEATLYFSEEGVPYDELVNQLLPSQCDWQFAIVALF